MFEIALIFIGLTIGFGLGWRGRELHAQRIVNDLLKDNDMSKPSDVMNVEVVKANDQFYIYNAETNAFIVQVKSKDELFEYFKNKYPQKTVMMKKEHFELFESA